MVSLFEDRPYIVDISTPIPRKDRLPTTPLVDDLPKADRKQATTAAIFSPLGTHIITGTSRGYINVIETETRKIIHSTKLSTGLISLLRLTSNGSQLLANSTDRIIRVVDMPDLSVIRPSSADTDMADSQHQQPHPDDSNPDSPSNIDPATLADNLHLPTSHKFQDLVNRLRWNHCAFSHTSSAVSSSSHQPASYPSTTAPISAPTHADYIAASTYMKKDIYIWELRTNSLLRILESREEPAIIEWHPSRPLLAATSIETGSIGIWGVEPQQKWSALAPDFTELTENMEYVEREDEFDTYPQEEHRKRRAVREDEVVDILTGARQDRQSMFGRNGRGGDGEMGGGENEDDDDEDMIGEDE